MTEGQKRKWTWSFGRAFAWGASLTAGLLLGIGEPMTRALAYDSSTEEGT